MSTRVKILAFLSMLVATLLLGAMDQTPVEAAPPIPIRWMYFVNGRSNDSLIANYKNIDIISPDYYRLNDDGTIRGSNHTDVTNFARNNGIKVIPMIQNDLTKDDFNQLFSNPDKVKAIIDAIEKQVVENNYDGYQVDFEDLNSATEPLLTGFMRDLNARLKARGKLTTMAVVSRTPTSTSQFSAAYNYAALSPYLDLVTIMTYDFHYSGGEPGAVAPVDWQERVMNYSVPLLGANKILLGVPFYGYDWNLTKRQTDKSVRAVSHSFDETMKIQQETNGTFGWDSAAQTPYLNYTKDNENHQVWFENARSLQAKFDLMKRMQVRGFAAWRLGHEGGEFWPVIKNLVVPTKPVPVPGPNTSFRTYYPQTGHTLQGVFKRYWEKYGGLAQFGYPWTEEFQEPSPSEPGKIFTVQYYERNRFEYHPEFAGSQYEVLLGLLGRQVTEGRENEQPFQRVPDPRLQVTVASSQLFQETLVSLPDVNYYTETGHTLRGAFKNYWEKNGALYIYGFPISEEFQEVNPSDGKTYTVQYFERNRFEFHPENAGTKYEVLLGLLGNQLMVAKGWL